MRALSDVNTPLRWARNRGGWAGELTGGRQALTTKLRAVHRGEPSEGAYAAHTQVRASVQHYRAGVQLVLLEALETLDQLEAVIAEGEDGKETSSSGSDASDTSSDEGGAGSGESVDAGEGGDGGHGDTEGKAEAFLKMIK